MRSRAHYLRVFMLMCVWLLLFALVLYYTTDPYQIAVISDAKDVELEALWPKSRDKLSSIKAKLSEDKLLLPLTGSNESDAEPSETQKVKLFQRELPNVPFDYWYRFRFKPMRLNATCANAPWMFKLDLHNTYWQNFRNANLTYRLYGAYFDARPHVPQGNVVRLLAMLNQLSGPLPRSYCQLWYQHRYEPVIVPVSEQRLIWYVEWGETGDYYPHLLTCVVPPALRSYAPAAVSLVAAACDTATNSLRVSYETPLPNETRHGFAVCVKGLDYPYIDMSVRLVEWLEMQRLLGARKVIMYELALHADTRRMLQYYVQQGFLELHTLTLATDVPSMKHYLHDVLSVRVINKRLNEVIPYNDCFYRNIYKYAYIVNVDVDELIMPLGSYRNWQQLVELAGRSKWKECPNGHVGVCARNVYFPINMVNFTTLPDVPAYMYMLQHVLRVPDFGVQDEAEKCFHNTSQALTLHNHLALSRLNSCRPISLEPDVVQLQHYRLIKQPEKWITPVNDRNIWRYKELLQTAVNEVLRELGYLRAVS